MVARADHHTKEWHDARRLGIGGSDWGDLLSLEPYGCARRLWYVKTDHPEDVPRVETGAMLRGHMLEPLIAAEASAATGLSVRHVSRTSEKIRAELPPWWIGNLDRGLYGRKGDPGVLECKSAGPYVYRDVETNGIPERWAFQAHHYLGLTGWNWAIVAVLEPLDWSLYVSEIRRDDSILAMMAATGDRFWRRVENGPPPDRLEYGDKRCRSCSYRWTCQGPAYMAEDREDDVEDGYEAIDSRDLEDLADRYERIRAVATEAKEQLSSVADEIKARLRGPRKVAAGAARISYVENVTHRLDQSALRAAEPEIAARFTRPYPSSRLTVRII